MPIGVKTSWNSTYTMLDVVSDFQEENLMFINTSPTSEGLNLDNYEFDHLIILRDFLKFFYDAKVDLSGTHCPISHLLLTHL